MPFVRIDRKGRWYKLQDMDGQVHWGRSNQFTHKIRCVVVKAPRAVTHKEPNNRSPSAEGFKTLDRYTPLKRVDSDDAWIQVEDDLGQRSWIHESNLWSPVTVQSIHF
jgi:hypothetical protein